MTGPSPLANVEADAHRLEDEQDVGEDDRRVDAEALDRRERHLGRGVGVWHSSRKPSRARTARYSAM